MSCCGGIIERKGQEKAVKWQRSTDVRSKGNIRQGKRGNDRKVLWNDIKKVRKEVVLVTEVKQMYYYCVK